MYLPDKILEKVEKPARYTGGELNSVIKDSKDCDIRFAFCFADSYEIGMSHLGMKLLYGLLNDMDGVWCERVFAPWPDLEKIMREEDYKLFALESQEEIKNFDFIAFTLQYELSYTNVINMIDLAGVPVFAKDRDENDPIIIGGGPSCINPEPIAEFFDLFNIGDGEEMLPEILECYRASKKKGLTKKEFLMEAAKIPGVYVPSFYDVIFDDNGNYLCHNVKPEFEGIAAKKIERRVISDFENAYTMKSQVVPYVEAIHDRIMLEIFRGCIRGCRFCQAGYIYRPNRERSPEKLLEAAKALSECTGYEEISLLSLATDDYTCLKELTDGLLSYTSSKRMNMSLPSLRVDSFSLDLMEKISKVRKSGLTFALEAGTQRLRDVINKGITEDDLMTSVKMAFENGFSNVKLYFMAGLPTETDEDLLGIAKIAGKVRSIYYEVNEGKKVRPPVINVAVSTFIPKAFTPFQWYSQISYEEIKRRLKLIRDSLGPKYGFSWQDPEISVVENLLSRGDRRASKLIYNVWKRKGGFDAWNEFFSYEAWMDELGKLGKVGYQGSGYPNPSDPLPWDIIDAGITHSFYVKELEKAQKGEITPNCREKCSGCGCQKYKGGVCVGKR